MAGPTIDDYRAQALGEGFDEVLVRNWPANLQLDTRAHALVLKAGVERGGMWLNADGKNAPPTGSPSTTSPKSGGKKN